MSDRYEIRYGKWGAYFYDTEQERPLTLQDVGDLLNTCVLLDAQIQKLQNYEERAATQAFNARREDD